MNRERLEHLRDVMLELGENRTLVLEDGERVYFHLAYFSIPSEMAAEESLVDYDCGTAACALGTAGLLPWFRDRGLITCLNKDTVTFEHKRDFAAGSLFFGITYETSRWLFDPSYYEDLEADEITPGRVGARVATLLEAT